MWNHTALTSKLMFKMALKAPKTHSKNICSSFHSNHALASSQQLKNKRQRGFSLVELMISVGIISLLAGVAVPSYISFTKNGKISEALATLMNLSTQLEKRFVDVRTYKKTDSTSADCGIELPEAKDDHYIFACSLTDLTDGYTLTASSSSSENPEYQYTINSNGDRATTAFDGNKSNQACWQINNSGGCY